MMEYGVAQKPLPPTLEQQKKARLALFGVFPDP
jgi:hypothetical protein